MNLDFKLANNIENKQSLQMNEGHDTLKYSGLVNFYSIKPQIPPAIGINEIYNTNTREQQVNKNDYYFL